MGPYCKIVGLLLFLTVFLESQAKDFAGKAAYLDFRTQVMTLHAMKGFLFRTVSGMRSTSSGMNDMLL